MTLKFIGKEKFPAYLALSSDIVNGKLVGHPILIGLTVYITDAASGTPSWYIITDGDGSVSVFNPMTEV